MPEVQTTQRAPRWRRAFRPDPPRSMHDAQQHAPPLLMTFATQAPLARATCGWDGGTTGSRTFDVTLET